MTAAREKRVEAKAQMRQQFWQLNVVFLEPGPLGPVARLVKDLLQVRPVLTRKAPAEEVVEQVRLARGPEGTVLRQRLGEDAGARAWRADHENRVLTDRRPREIKVHRFPFTLSVRR